MAYQQIDSIVRNTLMPTVADNISKEVKILDLLSDRIEIKATTDTIKQAVKKSRSTTQGSYVRGGTFDTTPQTTRDTFTFNMAQLYQNVSLFGIDISSGATGPDVIIDHLTYSLEEARTDFGQFIAEQMYGLGTASTSDPNPIVGLAAIADDGSNAATYGDETRSTYTWAKGGYTGSVGTLAFADLETAYNAVVVNGAKPDFFVTTPTLWTKLENLITLTNQVMAEKNVKGITLNTGAQGINFRGVPVEMDYFCTDGSVYLITKKNLFIHVMKNKKHGNEGKLGLSWTGWKEPTNQDASIGQFLWYVQMTSDAPRNQYQLDAATA